MCSLFLVAMLEAITQEDKDDQRLTRREVPVEGLGLTATADEGKKLLAQATGLPTG